ncbi:MAG: VRR-NUC domain-containing protein [Roseburia sp.]|nr:VRR-NUC domain-containing protein [Roseburia sp.]
MKRFICGQTRCPEDKHKCTFNEDDCPLYMRTIEEVGEPKREQKPKPLTATEDDIQETVIAYCELKGIIAAHVPNEARRSPAYGAKMKRMGLRKGFPDIFIPTARKGFHGLMIELKRDKKSRVSPEQLGWITYLNKQGYKATVCYGADEAIKTIEEYFGE